MYPLDMTLQAPEGAGHAVANSRDEHRALSALGYEPAIADDEPAAPAEVIDQPRRRGRPRKQQ